MTGEETLARLLEEARTVGLVGPGPVEVQVRHAQAYALAWDDVAGTHSPTMGLRALDLGSGAGLPGLVLAMAWPDSEWVLLDARARSTTFLEHAVAEAGLAGRVRVVTGRAEEAGRQADHRAAYGLVVARGFGPPAVTAECAAPLLAPGGWLVVSEPPGPTLARWDPSGLAELGLSDPRHLRCAGLGFHASKQARTCPDRYPRRVGVPSKRPLF